MDEGLHIQIAQHNKKVRKKQGCTQPDYLHHCIFGNARIQIKLIYKALLTSADISRCCAETQPKTPSSKQCRCRSMVAIKKCPRKKPREEPGYGGWPVLDWLCRVEIITEHGQDVQMFINDQHGQIIIITVVVEGATSQYLRSKCQLAFHSQSLRVSLPLLLSLES